MINFVKNLYMKVDYSWKVQWTSYSSNLILSKFQSFAAIYGAMWLSHYIPLLRLFKLKLLRSPANIKFTLLLLILCKNDFSLSEAPSVQ